MKLKGIGDGFMSQEKQVRVLRYQKAVPQTNAGRLQQYCKAKEQTIYRELGKIRNRLRLKDASNRGKYKRLLQLFTKNT